MFCPIILPNDNSGTPFKAELIPIKSSGEAVAKDINKKATVNLFKPKNSEILESDLTNQLPEIINKKQEAINKNA